MAVAHHLVSPLFLCIFLFLSSITSPMPDKEALLQFKESLQNADALGSWAPNTEPCTGDVRWVGVICYQGIVTGLRLEDMGLSGKIDVESLVKIPGLRTISIMNNKFGGNIPEFNRVGSLKGIFVSGNQFSGEIMPDYFSTMRSMKKVWLSDNQFTGEIPSSLAQLRNLLELRLENNQFTGEIPPVKQPPLEIPASLSGFRASSFEGNPGLCGRIVERDCSNNQTQNEPEKSPSNQQPSQTSMENTSSKKIVAAVATVCVVILSILAVVVFAVRRKRKEGLYVLGNRNLNAGGAVAVQVVASKESSSNSIRPSMSSRKGSARRKGGDVNGGGGMGDLVIVNEEKGVFGMVDLMKAAAEVLGNGGIGSAYKAMMANGVAVAVKRMKEMNRVAKEAFDAEMRRLASLKHRNILPPLAYHYRKEEKLVIYEYVPNGSLLYLLHGDHGSSHAELDWPARLKIIRGIARGMAYLHAELSSYELPHGNLKSSNILISKDNEPLIGEYGFQPLINDGHLTRALFAYKSPEAILNGTVSPKSDVYCLGVVILELLTGKFPSQYLIPGNQSGGGGIDVVRWVASAVAESREADLLDLEIASSDRHKYKMVKLLHVGVACAEANPVVRPDMKEVMRRVEEACNCEAEEFSRLLR
ncbi:hypothetical protein Nepgr_005657 [Nepenthes gracilis]|uniref:Protein kinase domain-containing protein n=1 Tax=Nepenthes gracilis TaxID=150966 RepID=A0AAD3S3L8_NEPGR|nr:hypothetical protein Nepgr_005657 [Nepenthes gracilis]